MIDQEEKSLPPTELGLEQAKRRGQVARSAELTLAAMLLGSWAVLKWSLPRVLEKSQAMMSELLKPSGQKASSSLSSAWPAVAPVAIEIAILIAGVTFVGILVNVLQVGLRATTAPVEPDLARISPAQGLKRIFSLRSAQRLAMAVVKLALVGYFALADVGSLVAHVALAARQSVEELLRCGCDSLSLVLLRAGVVMLVLGVIDYAYQWWQHRRDLRISPRQMRQEMRQLEGDPVQKRMRQRKARQLLSQQVQAAVPQATVLLASDRDTALAIRYEPPMRLPQITAKASGPLGRRMIRLATDAGVCMVEDSTLATTLYRRCPVRTFVPGRFLGRLAEIVAYAREVSPRTVTP